MRVEFMPAAFSGMSLNILWRMYSIYCGTSRKLRSAVREAITPASSSFSSSSKAGALAVWLDFLRGLLDEGDEVARRRPMAAAALGLRVFLIRDERAAVAWNDMAVDAVCDAQSAGWGPAR